MNIYKSHSLIHARILAMLLLIMYPLSSAIAVQNIKLDTHNISLSGLSSGGYMATQYHLSHADTVIGAGIIAAGPYNCARGSISTALSECINEAPQEYPSELFDIFTNSEKSKNISALSAMKDDKVWLLHGTKDTRVSAKAAQALHQQYSAWLTKDNLVFINNKPFAHLFPTANNGETCDTSRSPFIGNCGFDAAGELLGHIFGSLEPKIDSKELPKHGQLLSIEQDELTDISGTGLHDDAFVFVPKSCINGEACRVHISFHGCNQSIDNVKDIYAKQTGLNEWAASNRMLVLYPQVEISRFMPMNPQSCWDWWGYTDENYANKQGKQIQAIKNMVENLAPYLNNSLLKTK